MSRPVTNNMSILYQVKIYQIVNLFVITNIYQLLLKKNINLILINYAVAELRLENAFNTRS